MSNVLTAVLVGGSMGLLASVISRRMLRLMDQAHEARMEKIREEEKRYLKRIEDEDKPDDSAGSLAKV